jgi:coproporphyrinogen III oxidase
MSHHERVRARFIALRDSICAALTAVDRPFLCDPWTRPAGEWLGGRGEVRMIEGGNVFERAGVAFSDVHGSALPVNASVKRPHLSGKPFFALGVSLVCHPQNPYVPASHMNVRYFESENEWWFGGGFDLTPCYVFEDDARHWHQTAREASGEHYADLKRACDEYFYLKHRKETRGIGGLFADDLQGDFDERFALVDRIGSHFIPAYLPIVDKRLHTPFSERERDFQLYRRGRYVEFNLVFDRGTHFGLQSGGRTEAILLSMPPLAKWRYDWTPESGSDEAKLADYLRPRDWLV